MRRREAEWKVLFCSFRTGRQGIKGSADERVEAAVAVAVAVTGVHGKQVDGRSRDPARPANDFHF